MRLIEKVWFYQHPARWLLVPLLLPLSLLFWLLSQLRRLAFYWQLKASVSVSVPVVVVGNIGVGGNGKTPVTLALVEQLKVQGLKVGVVSRGYGAMAPCYPYQLTDESTAIQAGDEPLLIYQRCKVPVVIDADRIAACQQLVSLGCDIIIADDGLQHYRMRRDIELIVVDGKRRFGNGLLLPAGPLRELPSRLAKVDAVIINGRASAQSFANSRVPKITMQLAAKKVINIKTGQSLLIEEFLAQYCNRESMVNAVAGIGDPQRFFDTLGDYGFKLVQKQGFVDHQALTKHDLAEFSADIPLLMTEKDAVKCQAFAQAHYWYLPVDAQFSASSGVDEFSRLIDKLVELVEQNKN